MPTQAEIDAATIAIDTMNPAPVCTADIACVALAAAEAVRAKVAKVLREYEAYTISAPTDVRMETSADQRMTQTHAPLAGWKRTRAQSG